MSITRSQAVDETRRRQFEAAWFSGVQQAIEDYLPEKTDDRFLATLEELVHIDIEFRWKTRNNDAHSGQRRPGPLVEEYLERYPVLNSPHLVTRLLRQEYWVRSRFGEQPVLDEYCRRFELFADVDQARRVICTDDSMSASASASEFAAGQNLGRYRLVRKHALGGFGEVWLAFDPVLKREVALKTLRSPLAEDDESCSRFVTEARTTARLEHPGVVSVHDLITEGDAAPYYTMRFVGGETLADSIQNHHASNQPDEKRSVDRIRLLSTFLTVTRTVEFVHAQELIHRDLKPQNIILGKYGETAILDWGLAKYQGESDTVSVPAGLDDTGRYDAYATRHGTVIGTPAYMSPEQSLGRIDLVDELSDQYSLGVILYELLTGKIPFPPDVERLDVHDPARPRSIDRSLSPDLEAICLKAMSFRREDRYGSVSDLTLELERFLADEPVSAYAAPWRTRLARWVKRNRTLVFAVGTTAAVAACLLALGVILLLEANQRLAARENEAVLLRGKTESALHDATRHLYSHRIALAHTELLKNNVVRAQELLAACPDPLREWEWYYLNWLIERHQSARELTGHQKVITKVAFSPQGRRLASGSADGSVVIWNTETWQQQMRLTAGSSVRSLAFSPNGRQIAIGSTDTQLGTKRGVVSTWDLETRARVAGRDAHGSVVACVAYAPDSEVMATGGGDGSIRIRNVETLEPTLRIEAAHEGEVRGLVFHSSAGELRLLSCADDGQLKLWNTQSGELIQTLPGHQGKIFDCVTREADGFMVSAGADRLIRVWDFADNVAKGERINDQARILVGHTDEVRGLACSPDGRYIASGSLDRHIRLWDVATGRVVTVVRRHTSHVRTLSFSPGGEYLATAGDEGVVHVWEVGQLAEDSPSGSLVKFSPTSNQLAVSNRKGISIWDVLNHTTTLKMVDHPAGITNFGYSHDGQQLAAIHADGAIQLWNPETGALVRQLKHRNTLPFGFAFEPTNRRLAVAHADDAIDLWDVETGELTATWDLESRAYQLAFDRSGDQLFVGYLNGSLGFWDVGRAGLRRMVDAHDGYLLGMALHAEHDWVATAGSDGWVRIWDWQTHRLVHEMNVGTTWLNCLEFTPDGKRLASGSEHTITFWDTDSGQEVLSMSLDRCIHVMTFSADGNHLAVAGEDPRVRIWQGGPAAAQARDVEEIPPKSPVEPAP